MNRLFILLLIALPVVRAAPPDDLAKRPITTDPTPVGQLLKRWHAEGTAAGNVGDWYDNRDGEHSPLDLRVWPQLQKVKYSDEDFKLRRNWAAQRVVLPHVTFGNSSTSAPPTGGGSNPRHYYTSPTGLKLLELHYRKNNVYIYPEHRDHDPGRNGVGPNNEEGWGDLYPTNTPYLIISQGSSGTDQPFMRAIPFTLAAFRPEVKKLLVEKGLLMPTLQRILRRTSRAVKSGDDYYTAKAHPSVFEGANVDPLAMVTMAHEMTTNTIPPLAALKVVEEEESPVSGKDFFDLPGRTEKLSDTAHVVARVWRGSANKRRVVLSAADSTDVNGLELSFRWALLRGDPDRVTITPRGKGNVEAEIVLQHHPRRPIAPGSAMESNRIDIAVFAENTKAISAPAFFTYFLLDDEERSTGKIVYGATTTVGRVTDWVKLMAVLAADTSIPEKQRDTLAYVAMKTRRLREQLDELRPKRQEAEKKRNAAGARRVAAEKKVKESPDDAAAAREWAEAKTEQTKADIEFRAADDRVNAVQKEFDHALDRKGEGLDTSARAFAQARLTPSLPKDAVQFFTRPNYVDPRIAVTRRWVDEYDKEGGWTRRAEGKVTRFTPEGWLVTKEDEKGRAVKAVTVVYKQDPPKDKVVFNTNPLRWVAGDEEITFAYEDGKRVIKKRIKVPTAALPGSGRPARGASARPPAP